MPENAISATCQRFRDLILGASTGNSHEVTAGHFRLPEQTWPLEQQPEGVYGDRPFEVEWVAVGPARDSHYGYSGNIIDINGTIAVRVGYLRGAGRNIERSDDQYADVRLIRRVLEEPRNYDASVTGIVEVEWMGDRRRVLDAMREVVEQEFRVRCQESQPQ